MPINLKIVTPSGEYLNQEINKIGFKNDMGRIVILPNYTPYVTNVQIDEIFIEFTNNKVEKYAGNKGIFQIDHNEALLLIDTIESKEEIDIRRAIEAKERALQRINSENIDIQRAEVALKKAITRIKVHDE
ncbi:MAG: ATP synthase delta/epsilon chain alpha-helix domain-containing protein [Erysipelotrichaceae bacterium]